MSLVHKPKKTSRTLTKRQHWQPADYNLQNILDKSVFAKELSRRSSLTHRTRVGVRLARRTKENQLPKL